MLISSVRSPRASRLISAAVAVAIAVPAAACGSGGSSSDTPSGVVISTTRLAGADVLGNGRRPDNSCGPLAPPEAGVDPMRIVAIGTDVLDTLCALGLQDRVVGSAVDATGSQPSYLGGQIHALAPVGSVTAPNAGAIAGTHPDLVLSSGAPAANSVPVTGDWHARVRAVGAAVGRPGAADQLLAGFANDARQLGVDQDAVHTQASLMRFTDGHAELAGPSSFIGSVLAAANVQRPAPQAALTDVTKPVDVHDLRDAEGDLMYVSFNGPDAKKYGTTVMDGSAFKALSVRRDNRIFLVNDEVWYGGGGLVAARAVLSDLRDSLNATAN